MSEDADPKMPPISFNRRHRALVKRGSRQARWLAALVYVGILTHGGPSLAAVTAADAPPPAGQDPSASPSPAADENLPEIQAKTYALKVKKRSNSNRVYLFEDVAQGQPVVGRILLLKKEDNPVMAFRVLKTYPEQPQFAAKRVRRYGDVRILENDAVLVAVEKVGDIVAVPNTAEDNADLRELEGAAPEAKDPALDVDPDLPQVQPYDPELDAGTTPPPVGGIHSDGSSIDPRPDEDDDDTHRMGMAVEEVQHLDPYVHWITASLGYFRNPGDYTLVGGTGLYAAPGLRYGLSLGRMLFFRKARVQDSLVVEAGMALYRILGTSNDNYTILPLLGTIRYNIFLSEVIGLFVYAGWMQNLLIQVANPVTAAQDALQNGMPAGGGGIIVRVGPSWEVRADLGFDTLALGLALRF